MAARLARFDKRLAAAEERVRAVSARFAAAGYDLSAEGFDLVAYFGDVAEAEAEIAAVFAAARATVCVGGVAWSALYDAEQVHAERAAEAREWLARHESRAGSVPERAA
ncbi:hypothetical protein [Saccharothrix stipae]